MDEAITYAVRHLEACRKLGVEETQFIPGKGTHSVDGKARLRDAIVEYLREQNIKHEIDVQNEGRIKVWLEVLSQSRDSGGGWQIVRRDRYRVVRC